MNSDKNKKENKKALKIFIPVIIASGLIGGVLGAFSSTGTAKELAEFVSDFFERTLFLLAPYLIIAVIIGGLFLGFCYYRAAVKDYRRSQEEADEDLQAAIYMEADDKLSKGLMAAGMTQILALIFFATIVAYINKYIGSNHFVYILTLSVFVIGAFVQIKLQQVMVDFQKTMNPEKQGSVYDLNFQKKWENSCDEMEKLMIYKASHKAYKAAMKACVILFIVLMMFSFFFDYGPLPASAVGVIWLVTATSYFREAMRLGKDKINL